jgi:UDP-N-acetylglucosamine 2-epimerase (non-hydrolysing)
MKKGYTFVYGTRPEAIKLKTIIENLDTSNFKNYNVVYTGQQFDYALEFSKSINLIPSLVISLSDKNFTLVALFREILRGLTEIDQSIHDNVIVQGDTISGLAASVYTKLTKRNLIHVESGLRSYNKTEPFPEEINRIIIDHLSDVHITPTEQARQNLLIEGISEKEIYHFGQTGVDSIISMLDEESENENLDRSPKLQETRFTENRKILVTLHRKENMRNISEICKTVNNLSRSLKNYQFTFILHSIYYESTFILLRDVFIRIQHESTMEFKHRY